MQLPDRSAVILAGKMLVQSIELSREKAKTKASASLLGWGVEVVVRDGSWHVKLRREVTK